MEGNLSLSLFNCELITSRNIEILFLKPIVNSSYPNSQRFWIYWTDCGILDDQ